MKYLLTILILIFAVLGYADTLTVKQDGTGDYTIIQDAIDNAIDGDIVLVWPGTYFENLICAEKNLTIGSLILTTGNTVYIQQTVIDGNHNGSCFYIENVLSNITINGFTMQNGSGSYHGYISGGAIISLYSILNIYNCMIKDNRANGYGGGIYYKYSSGVLSGVTITNNHTYNSGGGIVLLNSSIEFDPVNKCNIFMNYAARGTDIYKLGEDCGPLHVVVDTFTVVNPDNYYLFSNYGYGIPEDDITYDISTGKIQQTIQDLYISNTGSNNNSGLNQNEPLKDISYALLKIASDSNSPGTINIANGNYTLSGGEKFPLSIKGNISIAGQNRDSVILDAENQIYLLYGLIYSENYSIRNLTLQHGNGDVNSSWGYGGVNLQVNRNSMLENVVLKENYGSANSCGTVSSSNGFLLKNVDFVDNIGGGTIRIGYIPTYGGSPDTVSFENCKVINTVPDYSIPDEAAGGGITVSGQTSYPNHSIGMLYNCLLIENQSQNINNGSGANGLSVGMGAEAFLINCTLADNTSNNPEASAIGVTYGSDLHIYNSIIYDNEYTPAYMYTQDWAGENNMNIYNSLVEGGEPAIRIISPFNNLYYDETNIDADPLFFGGWEYPYNLSDNSPCIDAGTLELPDWIELPEHDLAGNPRIHNGKIDMGAYEWNPTVGVDENMLTIGKEEKLLVAAPNPFTDRTTILVKHEKKADIKIEIYNNYGQRVRVLQDGTTLPGTAQINWNGVDDLGEKLPSGIYYVVMFEDGKEVESLKVILLN